MVTFRRLAATFACASLVMGLGLGSGPAWAQETIELQLWHNQAPDSIRNDTSKLFAKRVSELTGGQVEVTIFPGGIMGDSMANLEGQKMGSNDFSIEDPGLISGFDKSKRVAILQLPFLVEDYESAWKLMDSDVVKEVFAHMHAQGFRLLAIWENGIRNTLTKDRPIRELKDFRGLKIRVVKDPVMLKVMEAFGASPVPMAWTELYTALQHGVVDGMEGSIQNIYFGKMYERRNTIQ